MANNNETTVQFNADISGLKKGLTDANRQIRLANSQFQAAASGMDNWSNSADGLTAKISQLEIVHEAENKKLELLQQQYELTADALGENSKEAQELLIQINNQQSSINRTNTQLNKYRSQLDQVTNATDDAGDTAQNNISAYDKLSNEISEQETELKRLQREYSNYVVEGNEASNEAKQLATQISNLSGDLNANRTALSNANSAANGLVVAMNNIDNAADDTSNAAQNNISAYDKLSNEISEQETELKRLQREYSNYVVEGNEASNEAQQLATQISNLSGDLNANRTALSNADSAADGLAITMDDIDDAADNAGNSAQTLSDGFTAAKGAIADLVADGIKWCIDSLKDLMTASDKAFNTFQTKTGTSTEAMADFKSQISELYKNNYGESLNDVADVMSQVAQTSKETDPSKIQELTKNAIVLRDTFGFEVNETMRAANMLIDQFGMTGNEAFNLIAQGAQNGLNKNDDLLDSINEYSVHYKQLGYTGEEFFNSLENGAAAGTFSVDKLGDAVKEFGIRVREGGDDLNNVLASMGLVTQGVDEKAADEYHKNIDKLNQIDVKLAKGGTETQITAWNEEKKILQSKIQGYKREAEMRGQQNKKIISQYGDLYEKIGKGGNEAKEATDDILNALFEIKDPIQQNTYGVALFGTMWEDLGADGIKALTDITGSADTTKHTLDEINAIRYNDLGSAFEEITRIIKVDLLQPIMDDFEPTIKSFVEWLKNDAIPWIIENGDEIIATITGIGAALVAFKSVTIIQGIIGALTMLIPVIKSVGVAQAALNLIMAANPVGLIVAAIAGLITAFIVLWKKSDTFREFWVSLWETIKEKTKSAISTVVSTFTSLWSGITEAAGTAAQFISDTWTGISQFLSGIWTNVSAAAGTAWAFILEVFKSVATWFSDTIVSPISIFFSNMWDKIKLGAADAWNGITSVFGVVVDWFREKFSAAWQAVKDVFSVGGKIFDGIKDGIVSAFTTIVNGIIRGINKIITFPFNAINDMLNIIRNIEVLGIKPFDGLWGENPLSIPQIPELAHGGILKRGQIGLLEGDGAEAVVPLERNTQWIKRIAAEMSQQLDRPTGNNSTNNTVNNYTFNQTNNSPKALNRLEIYRQSKQQTAFIKAVTSNV